jgi:hypothetical protein
MTITVANVDPIYAAIKKHNAACAVFVASLALAQ